MLFAIIFVMQLCAAHEQCLANVTDSSTPWRIKKERSKKYLSSKNSVRCRLITSSYKFAIFFLSEPGPKCRETRSTELRAGPVHHGLSEVGALRWSEEQVERDWRQAACEIRQWWPWWWVEETVRSKTNKQTRTQTDRNKCKARIKKKRH